MNARHGLTDHRAYLQPTPDGAGAIRVRRRRDQRGDWTTSVYTLIRARGVVQSAAPGGATRGATGGATAAQGT
jgi:hypothetical protein